MIDVIERLTKQASDIDINNNKITFSVRGRKITVERGFDVSFRPCIEIYVNGVSYTRELIKDGQREKWADIWEIVKTKWHEQRSQKYDKTRRDIIDFMKTA